MMVTNFTEYKPNNPDNNGYGTGAVFGETKLGSTSDFMDAGGSVIGEFENSARLKYQFLDSATGQPVTISEFAASFLDFDDNGTDPGTVKIFVQECLQLCLLNEAEG